MPRVVLSLAANVRQALWRHLLPRRPDAEEAAFVYARHEVEDGVVVFRHIEWSPVSPDGFALRSPMHFELADETRATVIKRAHDLRASLIEFHSHIGSWPARFSASDHAGFSEFVPHVWWRLKGRPYLAVVVATGSFDGLVWLADPRSPEHLDGIVVEGQVLTPTRLSPLLLRSTDDEWLL